MVKAVSGAYGRYLMPEACISTALDYMDFIFTVGSELTKVTCGIIHIYIVVKYIIIVVKLCIYIVVKLHVALVAKLPNNLSAVLCD